MQTAIIPIEVEDTLGTIEEKISQVKPRRVVLILPDYELAVRTKKDKKMSAVANRGIGGIEFKKLDFILLKRYCQSKGKELGIVTRDKRWVDLAKEVAIPVFRNIMSAESGSWIEVSKEKKFPYVRRDKSDFILERKKLGRQVFITSYPIYLRWIIFLIGVFAVLSLAGLFVPSAQIIIELAEQTQSVQLTVRANPEIRYYQVSGDLPAYIQSVVVEVEDEAKSSGEVFLPDQAASGKVVLTNLTDQVVSVPAGTKLLTISESPVTFLTVQPVDVPPKGEVQVAIQALLSGSAGNVPAGAIGAFVDSVGLSLLVSNPEPTSGGTDRLMPVPTEKDVEELRQRMIAEAESLAQGQFRKVVKDGQIPLLETLRFNTILEEKRIPEEGQAGEYLKIEMKVEFTGWYIEKSDVDSLALAVLSANLPVDFNSVPNSLQVEMVTQPVFDKDRASWQILATQKIIPTGDLINLAELKNKTPDDAVEKLEGVYTYRSSPVIRIYPSWWRRMPFLESRMELILK